MFGGHVNLGEIIPGLSLVPSVDYWKKSEDVFGTDVDFSLSTSVGGIKFTPDVTPPTPARVTSDANGNVQTVVTSGTVATTVRVTAIIVGLTPPIGTQSSVLSVSTGLPDQDSFSWSVACPNIEALGFDGVENDVTVRLADRFQNPVPDGTAVSFTAEGGSIESSCQTTTNETQSGFCTVTWTSAEPRPANGRVTVLAHAQGEESFTDFNGNGIFDSFTDTFADLAEQFRDDNEMDSDGINGNYDAGEFFLDFDGSGTYGFDDLMGLPHPLTDGKFNGLLCVPDPNDPAMPPTECGISPLVEIGSSSIIIISGSVATITDNVGGTLVAPGTVTFTIGDVNGQPMPAGTTVKFEANNGDIIGPSDYVVPCTSFDGPLAFGFFVDADGMSDTASGVLTVETPGPGVGAATGTISFPYFITIMD